MIGNTFSISEFRLVNPDIRISRSDTSFNYTDLVARFTSNDQEEDSTESNALNVELKNISLVKGALGYYDLTDDRRWNFDDIDVAIPGLYFDNKNTDVDLDLRLVDGGELLCNAQYNNQLGTYKVNLHLRDINLAAAGEYIQDYLDIAGFGASLDANLEIDGRLGFLDQLTINGCRLFLPIPSASLTYPL